MKNIKTILFVLFITLLFNSCTEPLCNCQCTTKVYEVTELNDTVIESQLVGYEQGNDCNSEGYYITDIYWDGPYKHYRLYETYCY